MRWVIWVPWTKSFLLMPRQKDGIQFFETEIACRSYALSLNSGFVPCPHGTRCTSCRYKPVPWDQQAQDIASGLVLP